MGLMAIFSALRLCLEYFRARVTGHCLHTLRVLCYICSGKIAEFMEQMSKYDVVSVAYKSRFIFRTDAEYREALGVSFETVVSKRESERDVEVYYGILDREAAKPMDNSIDDIIEDYLIASDLYLTLDWGDRSHIVSRKKFCRMMFRLAITAGRTLSNDEIFKFKAKDIDKDLLKEFFPYGMEDAPMGIIGFVVLFAFGIVRPWNTEISRGHDIRDKETVDALNKLADLIEQIKDDTPRLGSTEKPLVFDQWGEIIKGYLHDTERLSECSPLMMLNSLMDIARACRLLVISEEQRIEGERFQGLYMHGIWIDDADQGKSRFWVFPDNLLAAMCYKRNGVGWEMDAYEFRVKQSSNPVYMDSFILMAPQGNRNYTLSINQTIGGDQMGFGNCEEFRDEMTGEITQLRLYDESLRLPEWLNWRKWEQLAHDDIRYKEFRNVLAEVYDPRSPHSVIFRNTAPELSDNVNNFVGHDNKYIYVYDWRPKRFLIRETEEDIFMYEGNCAHYATNKALFELNISDEHPLYAIPMNMERRKYGNAELDRLAEIMSDAENISEVYIIHSEHALFPRLVFSAYGVSVGLDMDVLSKVGILKFTHRPF